jgi:hypothetical protein
MSVESPFCEVPVRILSLFFFHDEGQNRATFGGDRDESRVPSEIPRFPGLSDHISFRKPKVIDFHLHGFFGSISLKKVL